MYNDLVASENALPVAVALAARVRAVTFYLRQLLTRIRAQRKPLDQKCIQDLTAGNRTVSCRNYRKEIRS